MRKFKVVVNGEAYEVELEEIGAAPDRAATPGPKRVDEAKTPGPAVRQPEPQKEKAPSPAPKPAGPGEKVIAPLPGTVLEVPVSPGDKVSEGDLVVVIEAMKMENEIVAPVSGTVSEVLCGKGDVVQADDVLLVISG